jgi:phage terminase small subunit
MTSPPIPEAPEGLTAASRATWKRIHQGWSLDDSGRVLLTVALQARDRADAARALIAAEGLVIASLKGTKPHPAVAVLRDAETTLLRSWRQLGLDTTTPGPLGRPPGGGPA